MSARNFPIKYKVDFGIHTTEEVKEAGASGCDEMMICSLVRFPDGKGSIVWHSTNGKPNETMRSSTMFSAWLALAAKISQCEDLNNAQREAVLNAINTARTKTERL